MNLTGLHFLLTYRCTYECDHCFVCSSPRAEATMELDFILDVLSQADSLGTITEIYFEGGEPFLYYPILLEAATAASDHGFDVGIVTNGWFGTSVEDARLWLQPFSNLGGISLSISDDTFHGREADETTPADRVKQAADELGIDSGIICIEPPHEGEDEHHPGEPILGGGVRFRGRAVETLSKTDLPMKAWEQFDECPDEDFIDLGRLHLDPYGFLYPCQGVAIGNIRTQPLNEIISAYNPTHHPIIGPLLRGGPAELARVHRIPVKGTFHDACHLCYCVRKVLRNDFPDSLAPGQVYGES